MAGIGTLLRPAQRRCRVGFPRLQRDGHRQGQTDASQPLDAPEYPALHLGAHSNNKNANSGLFLYDASYVRLKNLEIGYSLPKRWLSKVNIQNVRVYAQGLNLLTFDSLGDVDMDPETKSGDGSWYPIQRVFNFGITMTF